MPVLPQSHLPPPADDALPMLNRVILLLSVITASGWLHAATVTAQSTVSPVDDEGRTVQFVRDIAPILTARCWECHHGQNAKNGFEVDDAEMVLDFLLPGEAAESLLYSDYLITEDEDLLMPPTSYGGPLSAAELALIRVWIDEGADWPDDAVVGPPPSEGDNGDPPTSADQAATDGGDITAVQPLPIRFWRFHGYFHPAVVHFPIALLMVGALFVLIGCKAPVLGNHVALTCLYLGSISAVVASAMGWAFAAESGYGGWARIDFDSDLFWHRWSGVIVTSMAVVISLIALWAGTGRPDRQPRPKLTAIWKSGLLLLALLVALVGHQGGHLTFGSGHYERAFKTLWGPPAASSPETDVEESTDEAEADEADAVEAAP